MIDKNKNTDKGIDANKNFNHEHEYGCDCIDCDYVYLTAHGGDANFLEEECLNGQILFERLYEDVMNFDSYNDSDDWDQGICYKNKNKNQWFALSILEKWNSRFYAFFISYR